MDRFKLAVFDMAGTTVEEGGSVYRILRESIEQAGFMVPNDQLSQIAGMSKYEAIQYLLPEETSENHSLVNDIYSAFQQKLNRIYLNDPSVREKPGISRLFSFLRQRGIKVALNTGYSRHQADLLINRLAWNESIDFSITSDEVKNGRPSPDMILALMKKNQLSDSQQVIKIGDTINDVLEGKNAHCGLVVGVLGGAHSENSLIKAGADLILKKTSELEYYLTKETISKEL